MGLITETNAQYYAGQQEFPANLSSQEYKATFNTPLVSTVVGVSNTNFNVFVNNVEISDQYYSLDSITQTVTISGYTPPNGWNANDTVSIKLLTEARWPNNGEYEYIKLNDVIDNFLVAYVGDGKYINSVNRRDVIFHAKRGLQEFSYDTLRSIKSQELTIPESLNLLIPQDYVNYTRISWVDHNGVQRTIYPANSLTTNPISPLIQDNDGEPIQDNFESNIEATDGIIEENWKKLNQDNLDGRILNDESNVYNWAWWKQAYGQRYGLEPSTSQSNGWFTIDNRRGMFSFSSNLVKKNVIIEYISDGLAYDKDTKIPKMIEEAMYMHIAYSILAQKINVPEYLVQRFKKDRRAQLRNAKIRLQNLKLDTLIQTMRGKSKWLKH